MLDEKGFKKKTYSEVLNDMTAAAIDLFGSDINTDETSMIGKYLRVNAEQIAQLWEDVEGSYFSAFINTATGVSLDRKMADYNAQRNQAVAAVGEVTFTGTAGHAIAIGTIVKTSDDILFYTTEAGTIASGGTVTLNVACTEEGTIGNVGAGAINELLYSDEYITSVTNDAAITGGSEKETDYEFRNRINESFASNSSGTMDAIISAVSDVNGVLTCSVIANETSSTVNNIPPHSIQVYAYGGTSEMICKAIFAKKPIGVGTYGSSSETVTDIAGNEHTIYFSRPTIVNPYFTVSLTTNTDFPADGVTQVKTAIIEYVGGTDADNHYYSGLDLGDDVIFTKVISAINKIVGIDDFTLTMKKGSSGIESTSNIEIASSELAVTDASYITVTIV